jgi:Na+-transporting NADH:ubiquinone oxidoreductase subunit C
LEKLNNLRKDSSSKVLIFVLLVSLTCGILVSTLSILLRPHHIENMEQEQQRYLLDIIERQPGIKDLFEKVEAQHVEVQIVNLTTGQYSQTINPHEYDQRKAARDLNLSRAIPAKQDIAKLKRRANYAPVYLVRKDDMLKFLILPIHGKGYASTLYAYLGLSADANTVIGLNVYHHGETPGLGARMSDKEWLSQWYGKKIRDPEGVMRIGVARGKVIKGSPTESYEVDALSGATKTSIGVHNMVRFWLGDQGFGPYLRNLKTLER